MSTTQGSSVAAAAASTLKATQAMPRTIEERRGRTIGPSPHMRMVERVLRQEGERREWDDREVA